MVGIRELKKRETKNKELRAQLSYFLEKENYTKKQFAEELGMSPASLYNKLNKPEQFTLGELRDFIFILHLEKDAMLAII